MNLLSSLLIQKRVLVLWLCLKIDQNEELTGNHNSLKSNENEENSFLIDFVTTTHEKSKDSQVIADDLVEEKEKAELLINDLTVDLPLLKSQSIVISTDATASSKVFYIKLCLLYYSKIQNRSFKCFICYIMYSWIVCGKLIFWYWYIIKWLLFNSIEFYFGDGLQWI